MLIEIPVLIETVRHEGEEASGRFCRLRPVFFESPIVSNKSVDLGLHEMTRQLRDHLRQLHRWGHVENLARYSFAPEMFLRNVELAIELPRRFDRVFLPIVQFESEDRRIGYCPLLSVPPFEFSGSDDFHFRAGEVYRKYFQTLRKKSGESVLDEKLREFSRPRHFRLSQVECTLDPIRPSSRKTNRNQELLEAGRPHLEETGLCLDSLYPKKLDHALCRDEISERIYRLLTDPQRQAVLLVGPPKVGKTAIIHTVVSMMVQRLKRPRNDPNRQEVWQLTPGRLIAGMQMSGQWESRLNGIFALAEEKDLTLNFAQLLALLNTGKSAQGSLSMADMLLPALRRGRFRVVAEATEEQLRVLRERNRALADQFEIVHIPEPGPEENLRILLHAAREYEWNWKCRFDADLFPLLVEMTRQYENEAAMPGKAVHWLGSLAMQFQGENIDSKRFLDLFREKSGLRLSFFDPENYGTAGKKPEEIEEWFGEKIIGQRRAIAALRDVIVLAESLLSDPERPVASLFFAGPTGVGKTECARQLARYFFGNEDRLLRFDANELCTASAVARLVGSHLGGEGLLTGAVRRQPFSVILFDEIEKGHPDLFDLLLQVIGEARLTDTQGRVASFAQSIIIFTSNLGSRQVSGTLGFGRTGAGVAGAHDPTWMKAIQEFFRPEFVNRIDRIVPFDFLSTDELEQVADRMIEEMITRDGLKRRRARVLMTPGALRRITRQDTDPIYGARGMRRALQREFVAPLSRFLATHDSRNPAVIEVTDAIDGLHLQGFELKEAPEPIEGIALDSLRIETWPKEKRLSILSAIKPALEEIHEAVTPLRPTGRFDATGFAEMSGEKRLYFRLQDEYSELRQMLEEIQESEQTDKQRISPNMPSRKLTKGDRPEYPSSTFWKRLTVDTDLQSALDDLFADRRHARRDERFLNLLKRVGRLFEAVQAIDHGPQRALCLDLQFTPGIGAEAPFEQADDVSLLEDAWERRELDFATEAWEIPGWQTKTAVILQGFGALDYWRRREGSYLLLHRERMSVRARLVWEAAETDEEIRRSVLHRLKNSADKWPPVTRIGRQQSMLDFAPMEHVDLWPERFFLPESLMTLLW